MADEYSAAGRLSAVVDPTGRPHRDPLRRSTARPSSWSTRSARVTARRYDEFGNLAAVTAAGRREVGLRLRRAVPADRLDRTGRRHLAARVRRRRQPDRDRRPDRRPRGLRYDPVGRLVARDDGLVTSGSATTSSAGRSPRPRPTARPRHVGYDRCGRRVSRTGPGRRDHPPVLHPGRAAGPDRPARRAARAATTTTTAAGWPPTSTATAGAGSTATTRTGCSSSGSPRRPGGDARPGTRPAGSCGTGCPGRGTSATPTTRPGGWSRWPTGPVGAGSRRDAAGRVVAATDALGHAPRYAYDERGRLAARHRPARLAAPQRGYDELAGWRERDRPAGPRHPLSATTPPAGRASGATDRGPPDVDYDGRAGWPADRHPGAGRASTDHRGPGRARAGRCGSTETGAAPIELRWDAAGRLVERRRAGAAVGWAYDADGLAARCTTPTAPAPDYRRDGAGRVAGSSIPCSGRIELAPRPGRPAARGARRRRPAPFGLHRRLADQATTWRPAARAALDPADPRRARPGGGRGHRRPARLYGYDAAGQLVRRGRRDRGAPLRLRPGGPAGHRDPGPAQGARHHRYDAAGQLA